MTLMEELTSKEFDEYRDERTVVIIPVGALEEHGDHLPLNTDIIQPVQVIRETVDLLKGEMKVLIAPTISYGMVRSTRNFPGSVTLRFDTVRNLAFDVMKGMADNALNNIVVMSGHAGRLHMTAIRIAAHELIDTPGYHHLKIMVLSDYDLAYEELGKAFPSTDGHSGELETSRVLAIHPNLVKGKGVSSHPEFPPFRILRDAERYFPSGVMGDPTNASAEKGRNMNRRIVEQFASLIRDMVADSPHVQS